MQFTADPEMQEWLGTVTIAFDWDEGNSGKSERKHEVSDSAIEALFTAPFLLRGRIVEPAHVESRWLLLGVADRPLALVFTVRGGKVRAISCRAMRKSERSAYAEASKE